MALGKNAIACDKRAFACYWNAIAAHRRVARDITETPMENLPTQSPLISSAAPSAIPLLPLAALAPALGDVTRWRIVATLAAGESLLVSELATRLGRSPDMISKHLARLRTAGIVEVGRARLYNIPARFMRTPGVADFGHCQITAAV